MNERQLEIEEHINDDEDDFEMEDGGLPCSCSKCFCCNETEYGEVCGDCYLNQHQG